MQDKVDHIYTSEEIREQYGADIDQIRGFIDEYGETICAMAKMRFGGGPLWATILMNLAEGLMVTALRMAAVEQRGGILSRSSKRVLDRSIKEEEERQAKA